MTKNSVVSTGMSRQKALARFVPLVSSSTEESLRDRARTDIPVIVYAYARYAIAEALASLPKGDILVPTLTCSVVANAVITTGHHPVYYDIAPDLTIGPEQIMPRLTSQTVGVIAISYFGWETVAIEALSKSLPESVYCLVDAAHSLPLSNHNISCDRVYSFRKSVGSSGGACLLSPDITARGWAPVPETNRRAREAHLLAAISELAGSDDLTTVRRLIEERNALRHSRGFNWEHAAPTNDDINHITTLDFEKIASNRRRNARWYLQAMVHDTNAHPAFSDVPDDTSPLAFPIWVNHADDFVQHAWVYGVETARWWKQLPGGCDTESFPNSARVARHLVQLPVHQGLNSTDIHHVLNMVCNTI
jgi:hypothetical protein